MRFVKGKKGLKVLLRQYLSMPAVLWIMLWFSINTGPWVLSEQPDGLLEYLHYIRTLFPFLVILVSVLFLAVRLKQRIGNWSGPLSLWIVYGIVGLFACFMSPEPLQAAYWALAYLSVFGAMRVYLEGPDVLEKAVNLNSLSFFMLTSFLIILVIFSRDVLLIETGSGMTGYGIEGRMQTVGGMAMSRSSGLSRFAAVPGLISFVFLWFSPGWKRVLWLIPLFFCAMLIYYMQSRGALIGFVFAMAFVMFLLRGRKRLVGVILLTVTGLVLASDLIPGETFQEVSNFLRRGESMEELRTLTGRTRAWEKAWPEILDSPVVGWGFQADRLLIREHVHNTHLYALMTAGFMGGLAFVGGLLWVWLLFFRVIKSGIAGRFNQETLLIQSGGILAFFTIRGIAEVSGPLFNIDFLVMLPIMAYLSLLDRHRRSWLEQQREERRRSGVRT